MVLSADHLNVILLATVLPTMCSITNRQHNNIFNGRSEGQRFFGRDVQKCRKQRIISLVYVFLPIRKMLPAVHFSGATSLPTPQNTCIGQGHDGGLALSVNVWIVKGRTVNTGDWKELSVAVGIVALEIAANRTGRGQQCNRVIHRDEITLLLICAFRIFSHVSS